MDLDEEARKKEELRLHKNAQSRVSKGRKRAINEIGKLLNKTADLATQAVNKMAPGSAALQLGQQIATNIEAARAIAATAFRQLQSTLAKLGTLLGETADLAKRAENVMGQQITANLEAAKAIVATTQ